METKGVKIIVISHDEAQIMGLSLSHRRQVGSLSVFYHLLSSLVPLIFLCFVSPDALPLGFCREHAGLHQSPSGETSEMRNHCSPPLIRSSF